MAGNGQVLPMVGN